MATGTVELHRVLNIPVFIFFGKSGEWHGYDDELCDDGKLFYIGEGKDGDMTMNGGNAAIRNHSANGDEIHVFESREGLWEVTYDGQVKTNTKFNEGDISIW
ncbi:hypothetical protein ACLI4U_17275 [Natrialbaceae archaeon A-CW2]